MRQAVKHVLPAECRQVLALLVVLDDATAGLVGDIQVALVIGSQPHRLTQDTRLLCADLPELAVWNIENKYVSIDGIAHKHDPLAHFNIKRLGKRDCRGPLAGERTAPFRFRVDGLNVCTTVNCALVNVARFVRRWRIDNRADRFLLTCRCRCTRRQQHESCTGYQGSYSHIVRFLCLSEFEMRVSKCANVRNDVPNFLRAE